MQKTAPSQHIHALAADSIKLKGVKYYVQRTNYFDPSKPYLSLDRAGEVGDSSPSSRDRSPQTSISTHQQAGDAEDADDDPIPS
jgi:hypothetical protein